MPERNSAQKIHDAEVTQNLKDLLAHILYEKRGIGAASGVLPAWVKNLLALQDITSLFALQPLAGGPDNVITPYRAGYGFGSAKAGMTSLRSSSAVAKIGLGKKEFTRFVANTNDGERLNARALKEALCHGALKLPNKDAANFCRGFADGLVAFEPDQSRDSLATPIQLWLLTNWRAVERFPSVPALYRHFTATCGEKLNCDQARFAQICQRAKLRLRARGRPRKLLQ